MKAVVKTAPGDGNIEVREIDEPATPAGHVKIAVRAAGICGTDLHIYHDEYRSWPPVVLGHEVAGEVAEVGDGVEGIAPGERVTTETYFSTCGVCRFCRTGRVNLCPRRRSIGSAVNGGFTSYLVVPARNVHRLPADVGFVAGALTEPLACVVHGALEQPKLTPGDVAVVAGPGTIGLLTMQAVKAAGAGVIVLGTDADGHRLQLARELGADHVFNVQRDDYRAAIAELTGDGADIVYECSGAGPAAASLLELVRRGGQYAQIGLFGKPISWDLEQVCYKELTVTGSNASVPSAWKRALALLADGRVRTEPLVTSVRPLTEWREAFEAFERRDGLKTVLQPVD
ncbi:MAG TPA: zinc-binding dehydrogenase [Chloroflexota bacterium]|nr:zinc-binding dehydrogenase [Chloroflexota bacterium]